VASASLIFILWNASSTQAMTIIAMVTMPVTVVTAPWIPSSRGSRWSRGVPMGAVPGRRWAACYPSNVGMRPSRSFGSAASRASKQVEDQISDPRKNAQAPGLEGQKAGTQYVPGRPAHRPGLPDPDQLVQLMTARAGIEVPARSSAPRTGESPTLTSPATPRSSLADAHPYGGSVGSTLTIYAARFEL
jgi:hypothetical protein